MELLFPNTDGNGRSKTTCTVSGELGAPAMTVQHQLSSRRRMLVSLRTLRRFSRYRFGFVNGGIPARTVHCSCVVCNALRDVPLSLPLCRRTRTRKSLAGWKTWHGPRGMVEAVAGMVVVVVVGDTAVGVATDMAEGGVEEEVVEVVAGVAIDGAAAAVDEVAVATTMPGTIKRLMVPCGLLSWFSRYVVVPVLLASATVFAHARLPGGVVCIAHLPHGKEKDKERRRGDSDLGCLQV